MYNNSYYSHSKLGVSTKKIHKARGKSCGYYMKIVFFFSSLIQTLIIVSLVLFLIYGQPEESALEKRLQELDPVHNELKVKYGYLLDENRNLTWKINKTNREMGYMRGNITMLQKLGNQSASIITGLRMSTSRCPMNPPQPCNCPKIPPSQCPPNGQLNALQYKSNQLKDMLDIVNKNFSDTVYVLKAELKMANEERLSLKLDKIALGQEKTILEDELKLFKKKCQDDFIKYLEGIPEITKAFRQKIDTLFPHLIPFHITCEKQHEQLEQIRNNCSSLSAQVENKFYPYLDNIVHKVSNTMVRASHFQAKTITLERALDECKKNLSSEEEKHYNSLREIMMKNDRQEKEHLLNIKKLSDNKQLLDKTLSLKESEINMLKEKINTTSAFCGNKPPSPKPGTNPFPGGVGTGTGGKLPGGDSTFPFQSRLGMNSPSAPGLGSSANVGSFGTGFSNTGGTRSGPGTGGVGSSSLGALDMGTGAAGFGSPSRPTSGSSGAGFSMGSFGAGSSRSGPGGTGFGSSSSSGSSGPGLNTGSFGSGTGRSAGTGFGSSSSSASSGPGLNSGPFATGTGRSGSAGTGSGSSSSNSPSSGTGFNTGSFGAGTGAGNTGTGFGSTGSMGPSGVGFGSTGSLGAGSSRTQLFGTGSANSGMGNTGFGGAGSSRAGPSGTGPSGTGFGGTNSYGSFGSGGTGAGWTGMGASGLGQTRPGGTMGMYGGGGTSDPISKHLRELQKYLNPGWQ